MKYIFLSTAAILFCFGAGYLLTRLFQKLCRRQKKSFSTILCTLGMGIFLLLVLSLIYFSIYYPAGEKAKEALQGNSMVSVDKVDGGYRFDGPGEDKALVFYPGAKVASEAYAPLMLRMAESGIDCFLADMPFHFALFGSNAADSFLSAYSYDSWIMAGHSMGGIVASNYANSHTDQVKGVLLLASYPTKKINSSLRLLSVYGSEDGCLEKDQYEQKKTNWPKDSLESKLNGGNHAQFGDYGIQTGDGVPTISAEEQQAMTADTVSRFFD